MKVSPGPKTRSDAGNTLLLIPKDSPNLALLHRVLGGRQVLRGRAAQGLPSLQEALSHPVEDARYSGQPLRKSEPRNLDITVPVPKVTGTHWGSCSASEANGALQDMGRRDKT